MAEGPPVPFSGPRGIRGLQGTITGLAARGYTLQDTLGVLESVYAQYGGRWTSQSAAAASRVFQNAKEQAVKTLPLGNYRPTTSITARHISYGTLERTAQEFFNNPAYNVRYHVVGTQEGAPVDLWRTATYQGPDVLPTTFQELIDNLNATANTDYTELLYGSDTDITEAQITAV